MSFTAGAGTRYVVTSTTSPSGGSTVSGPFTITGGTATTNTPVLDATQTWNAGAVTFTGWRFNVTDTASNASSLLMDLQRGGASQFAIYKDGAINIGGIASANVYVQNAFNGTMKLHASYFIGWQNGAASPATTSALSLSKSSSDALIVASNGHLIEQRNGVNAQTFNIYNTFTDASNYERGVLQWAANILTIGAQSAGTGTARDVVLQGGNRLYLKAGGVTSWELNAANGHILAATDNTYDIGASGSNRPRTIFAATSVLAPYVRTSTAYTVATLPAAATAGAGARAFVTDATVTTFASIVAGGGANAVPVVSTGTNWIIG